MTERKQLETIPVSALHGRASRSADAAREAQIAADLALTPIERIRKALSLGARRARGAAGGEGRSVRRA